MFKDRKEAGKYLSEKLRDYKNKKGVLIIGIPRGGIVVGGEIAQELNRPLVYLVVKKLVSPDNKELAIGAVTQNNIKIIDWDIALRNNVSQEYLDAEIKQKSADVILSVKRYKISQSKNWARYNTFILVDDGVATGATIMAALKYINEKSKVKSQKSKIILAVPIIAKSQYFQLGEKFDRIESLDTPESFSSVGEFYKYFPQINDEEVIKLLKNNQIIGN